MYFDLPNITAEQISNLSTIKCAIFDVDGVMTSGQLHYSSEGELVKVFNVLDGQGIKSLQENNITVAVISAKRSDALIRRLDDLGVEHRYLGTHQKLNAFDDLLNKLSIIENECCYTGDDIIDIPVMERCGFSFSVPNGYAATRNIADQVTHAKGGEGAVREVCDYILYAKQAKSL